MAKGVLIKPDGSHEEWFIDGYEDIKEAVGGDFDWTSQSDIICYCYEWALHQHPVNPVATAIYWAHNGIRSELAGPVLISGAADIEGNETDVPEKVLAEIEDARARLGQDEINRLAVKMDPDKIPGPQIVKWEPGPEPPQ
jgi:hypothetical protein